jgi:poly(glycerol-phosphate) alpha-glucosyltransferase
VEALVRAFKQADVPGARLVIAGPDEGMLATLNPLLDERIVVTGYLEGEARLAAFAAADVLALPAVGEGLPMVVLEAMGAGLPVIISPGCNLPEVVQHGAGLEVAPEVSPLATALRDLLSNDERRMAMGQAARVLVREHFTWDAVAAQLEHTYGEYVSLS